jgi:hypothetical protein
MKNARAWRHRNAAAVYHTPRDTRNLSAHLSHLGGLTNIMTAFRMAPAYHGQRAQSASKALSPTITIRV